MVINLKGNSSSAIAFKLARTIGLKSKLKSAFAFL